MTKLITEIKVVGMEPIKSLIDLLADNFDALPEAVQDSLVAISEGEDISAYNADYLEKLGTSSRNVKAWVDGESVPHVLSGHRIGRVVRFSDCKQVKADSFWITREDQFICGWGEKPNIKGLK